MAGTATAETKPVVPPMLYVPLTNTRVSEEAEIEFRRLEDGVLPWWRIPRSIAW